MIKVNDVNKTRDLATGGKTQKTSGGESFSLYLKETMKPSSAPVGGSSSISVADAIFAAQMVNGEEEREIRKKLVKKPRPCWKNWKKSGMDFSGGIFPANG